MQLADNVMTTHTLHVLCKCSHLLLCKHAWSHYFFFTFRSAINANNFRLYRGICNSSRFNTKAPLYVFRWKSNTYIDVVQEWQKGTALILISKIIKFYTFFFPSHSHNTQINSQTKNINSNAVQSELNIIANITDNQAIYRCEAQNSATDVPLFDKKTLSVHCK